MFCRTRCPYPSGSPFSGRQARALGLRHTLLANLPSNGTVVHDCSSYMQQVGCPKRDLYLLSSSKGAPPFSLAIAPALLQLRGVASHAIAPCGANDGSVQIVLYVAVAMQLPIELLNEILAHAHQLAVRILAPLLTHKLAQSGLAEEWMLLLGKCSSGRNGNGGATAGRTPALSESNGESSTGNSEPAGITVGAGGAAGNTTGGQQRCSIGGDAQGSHSPGVSHCSDRAVGSGNEPTGANRTEASGAANGGSTTLSKSTATAAQPLMPAPACANALGSLAGTGCARGPLRADAATASGLMLSTTDIRHGSQVMALSTELAGTFAGDTRTHMGMLVSSFKDTINGLQARRAEESEELSVLKLGKVLGCGGSGLVFQGYLHLGLEVAVKLFENPDDADPDGSSSTEHGLQNAVVNLEGSSVGTECGAAPNDSLKEQSSAGNGSGSATGRTTATAALKTAVAQTTKRQRDLLRNALELGVTSSLSHPNIVQGYCHWVNVVLMQDASLNRCWLMGQAEYMALAPPGSPQPPLCSALVMEYCDMGSLIHALKRGTFSMPDGKPNMEFVYMCLLEIALALRHLHTANLAHCDLKPGNVLLRSSPRDLRGFVCKLGDFGYAAILKDGLLPGKPAMLPDEACGTLQYMAPELFVAGRPVDASIDIYAFGMLMWELITGRTPYSENEYPSRSLMKAVYHGKRPSFPENTLSAYKNLAMCCWSSDPNLRPSATVLVKLLRQQLESFKQQLSTASSASTGSRA
ncbi:hypothetical protein Vretimale_15112 [Volvox reticuliferus]|uniref:Protein kinase domain-containing protein n=1 Tax=Volvox reticuliferus TaxID=1737510 RepID=A0A8J4LVV0_9CHLO|nr:hypothetical protein Vretimale_15112 [Volvox reticuliferus]